MRNAFAGEIEKLADQDERIVLLTGDIGNRMFDSFKERYPNRFYNCGVAEANMTGVAAGLALCGFRPFTYTISSFNTIRCLEQIRVDIAYQNLPVVLVGVGGGLPYASLNPTHQSLEDIAALRVLPNMTVICPGDAMEVQAAVNAAREHDGPIYLRLGKKNEPLVHDKLPDFTIGRAIVLKPGSEVCILSTGNMLPVAMEAMGGLEEKGVSTQVVSFHTVKPHDEELLKDVFTRFSLVVTMEEHSVLGGFGGSVAEWLADSGPGYARLHRFGTADRFMNVAGGHEYAREYFGLSARQILDRILQVYQPERIPVRV